MPKKRKAQISIEYVAGFIFFLFAVLFVIFNILDTIPKYFSESNNAVMHETAWLAGEKAAIYALSGGAASAAAVANMSKCSIYSALLPNSAAYNNSKSNYTSLKDLLGIPNTSEFRLTLLEYALLIPNGTTGINHTGLFSIDGAVGAFEIFNYTPGRYNGVHVGTYYAREKEQFILSSQTYNVEKIDPAGAFAIVSRPVVDCGRQVASGKNSAAAKRYTVYNGTLARLNVVVWK